MSSDEEWGYYQYRAVLAVGLLFAGFCVFSVFDLVFMTIGREGEATVSEVYKTPGRREAGILRNGVQIQGLGWQRTGRQAPLGRFVRRRRCRGQIRHSVLPMWLLDAPDAARPKRPLNWVMLSLFLLVTAALGFFAYRAIYQSDDSRPTVRRRR